MPVAVSPGTAGGGDPEPAVPALLGRMVVSFFVAPGAEVKNVAGLKTIWSMEMPSSRRWTRIRWRA